MQEDALVVRNLSESYGKVQVIREVSFSIPTGEIFGLLGPNGAGKSTILSALSGLMEPTAGNIWVNGLKVNGNINQVKKQLGLVPQELALYPSLSAYENLEFFARIYGLKGKDVKERVNQLLDIVQLRERANESIDTYSGGMKRRINLAAGLLHEPSILFLDEPTVGVDPQSRNAIFESIEALNRKGMTIIYTTQYMEEAERLCHRIAILDHGQIIAMDTPTNLIQRYGHGRIHLEIADGKVGPVSLAIQNLANIQTVTHHDQCIEIKAQAPQEALVSIFEEINKLDAQVVSLQILNANLETVFLNLTGKNLRE
jgi:ABC-2 type transport system ATP-binding protein